MTPSPSSPPAVFVFVDGWGLAPESDHNPTSAENLPYLTARLGGPPTSERIGSGRGWSLCTLDATLGVPGLPQSATGQASLFTGCNAAELVGRHVTALPGPRLRALVEAGNLWSWARERNFRATFANAYTGEYLERIQEGAARRSVTTVATTAAGIRLRDLEDLGRGRAVCWDVGGDLFARRSGTKVQKVEPQEAGRRLAALALDHDLVVYETFVTDLAGHGRELDGGDALRRVDGLIEGLVEHLPSGGTVVITSDHGNVEDLSVRSHTENPVPLLVLGAGSEVGHGATSIVDVTPAVLGWLASR